MSRVLFGVMGDARGHVSRALALVQELPQHQFLFLGGGETLQLKKRGFSVVEAPMASTCYSRNGVDVFATAWNGIKVISARQRTLKVLEAIVEDFDPDVILTDYEFFAPLVARRLRIPCISVDHQHFLTRCLFQPPRGQTLGRLLLKLPLKHMYSKAQHYLITAFFQLPVANPEDSEVFPPILRRRVTKVSPVDGDHVLVYQTSQKYQRLLPALTGLKHRCIIYGFGSAQDSRNLWFRGHSEEDFLEDLASCRYVITNGGHNVISEALYLGKPVFSFPIPLAYEQFFNAHMLEALGYGEYSLLSRPGVGLFESFENRLAMYRSRISQGDFCGNKTLAARVEELIYSGNRRETKAGELETRNGH